MSEEQFNKTIMELLRTRPGHIIILPDGTRLYALTHDSEGKEKMFYIEAEDKNFKDMTDEEVNAFITKKLKS